MVVSKGHRGSVRCPITYSFPSRTESYCLHPRHFRGEHSELGVAAEAARKAI